MLVWLGEFIVKGMKLRILRLPYWVDMILTPGLEAAISSGYDVTHCGEAAILCRYDVNSLWWGCHTERVWWDEYTHCGEGIFEWILYGYSVFGKDSS